MTERARVGVVALVGLLVGALAAMTTGSGGPSGDSDGPLNLIAHSADVAAETGSARAEFTMSMSVAGAPAMELSGDADLDFGAPAFAMSMQVAAGEFGELGTEVRLVDTIMYMRLPVELGAPTPWISVDLDAVGGGALANLGTGTDVTQTLAYLRGAGDVTELGRETIRGVETTRYQTRVDLATAAGQVPSAQRAQVEAAIEQFEAMTGMSSLPVDAWIDDSGLPRRISYTLASDQVSMSFSMDVFDYGEPVSVAPPPAAEVTDVTGDIDDLPFA